MAITKIKSKKYGYTYQVDVRYKDYMGVTQRYVKSGFRTKAEARKHEASIIDQASSKSIIPNSQGKTINDVFEEYMEIEGEIKYAPTTKFNYRKIHRLYVEKNFGKRPIAKVDYAALQRYINDIYKKIDYSTVWNIKKIFAVTFKYAVRVGYISHNPVKDITISQNSKQEKKLATISDEDLGRIIERLHQPPPHNKRKESVSFCFRSYEIALIIGRYTGLRLSEVLALKKEDFDLENHRLYIQRRIEYAGLQAKDIYLSGKLKTKGSKTVIEINKGLCVYLKKWLDENPYDLVVCDSNGNLIYPPSMTDQLRKIAKDLDIKFHFHMLRHTFATELMMADVKPVVVKDLLRHSTVNTTWNVYTHPHEEIYKKTIDSVYKDTENSVSVNLSDFAIK